MGSNAPHALRILLGLAFAASVLTLSFASMSLDRLGFRLSYRADNEKMQRIKLAVDGPDLPSAPASPGFAASPVDTLLVQASCVDAAGNPAYPQQAFLRFVNTATGADSIYVLQKKTIGIRIELSLRKEIRSDVAFWRAGDAYRVEVILGDVEMDRGMTWVVTERMTFEEGSAKMFGGPARGVFDFDVGVKKTLLPEFITPLATPGKRAHSGIVLAFVCIVLLPLPVLLWAWWSLGVFPLQLPSSTSAKASLVGFEMCLLAHMGALCMFWLRWDIVMTWKIIAVLMVPTVVLGQQTLSASAKLGVAEAGKTDKAGKTE